MKIDFRGNDFIVFLNNKDTVILELLNKKELETYFRKLFLKIKKIYNIDLTGSYDITVYIDSNIGTILDIKKDDIEYCDYYKDTIDMKITISKYDKFLYKIEENIDNIIDKCTIYLYDNQFYALANNLSFIEQGILIENSSIVYGNTTIDIIEKACVVKNYI